jgi:hypothetical protein
MLAELPTALDHDDHRKDIATLEESKPAVDAAAARALAGDLDPESETAVREALAVAERILRRRRVLGD